MAGQLWQNQDIPGGRNYCLHWTEFCKYYRFPWINVFD